MSRIKHVAFDIWGTMCVSNPEYGIARAAAIYRKYPQVGSINKVMAAFKSVKEVLDTYEYIDGNSIPYDFKQQLLCRELGLPPLTYGGREWRYMFSHLFAEKPPKLMHTNVRQLFSDCMSNFQSVSVISNTHFIKGKTMQRMFEESLNIPVKENNKLYWYSSDEGAWCKPHLQPFLNVIHHSGVKASEILFVGNDNKCDIEPAERLGMQTHLITNAQDWQALETRLQSSFYNAKNSSPSL